MLLPQSVSALGPELFLLVMASITLLLETCFKKVFRHGMYLLVQISLLGTSAFLIKSWPDQTNMKFFADSVLIDTFSQTFKIFLLLFTCVVFTYVRTYVDLRVSYYTEYFVLLLLSLIGMMLLVSSNNFITLYMSLELLSFPLYAAIGMSKPHSLSSEAAIKYFILGAVASAILLYGMSLLYGAVGHLNFTPMPFSLGVFLVLLALVFKLGAAPMHMWLPDVYAGSPTSTTLFLASVPKVAAVAIFIKVISFTFKDTFASYSVFLQIISVLSLTVGIIVAITQTNIKRMLAYSAIGHAGFLLLGLLAGVNHNFSAVIFYVVIYGFNTLAAFGVILWLSRSGFEAHEISDFKGLSKKAPFAAFGMLITMFSLAGVPPTAGFYAKFMVMRDLMRSEYFILAILAMMFSVVGAFYYLRIIWNMYFEPSEDSYLDSAGSIPGMPVVGSMCLVTNNCLLLVFGVMPAPLWYLCLSISWQ
jgi:NADH-quinone oxidoreductase subunit N